MARSPATQYARVARFFKPAPAPETPHGTSKGFAVTLLAGWGILGVAGILYARASGIPVGAAWPALAAFLVVYPFYLVPAFSPVRERITGASLVCFALAATLLPYLACCCGAVEFRWSGVWRLAAVALGLSLWYRVLPPSRLAGLALLAVVAAVLLGRYFNPVFTPADASVRELKNIIVIPHISLIAISVTVLMTRGRIPETGYGFVPDAREWRIGLLHTAYFVAVGLPLALLLGATRFGTPKPAWYIGATFIGVFWVVSLSEEFFVRGVLQQWLEEWIDSRQGALVVASTAFGLLHLWMGTFPNWKWAAVAGLLGWFCGRARNQAGSIRASMVTHAMVATAWRAFFV
jgi:uncharacterized protein